MKMSFQTITNAGLGLVLSFLLSMPSSTAHASHWLLIDNFEGKGSIHQWTLADTKNDTVPHVPNPQVSVIENEHLDTLTNHYLLKKPAAEGVVGNRKALTYKALPTPVALGDTYTFYTRINVEYFPNNHAFGLSNMIPKDIELNDYNAFEPTLRVTDKTESNGHKNTGVLMVKTKEGYANIKNAHTGNDAMPLVPGIWYEIWYVVNNAAEDNGGQTYDVYVKGGTEFVQQQKVYTHASFRMRREAPLIYFLMNTNTGPADRPYGNGGLKYDDLYMVKGVNLSRPF
jgi:hypothetical protein